MMGAMSGANSSDLAGSMDAMMKKAMTGASGNLTKLGSVLGQGLDNLGSLSGDMRGSMGDVVKDMANSFRGNMANMDDCSSVMDVMAKFGKMGVGAGEGAKLATSLKGNANCRKDLAKNIGDMGMDLAEDLVKDFDTADIDKMTGDAFKNIAGAFGTKTDWSADEAAGLVGKAKEAWGSADQWSGARMESLGTLAGNIDAADLLNMDKRALGSMGASAKYLDKNQIKTLVGDKTSSFLGDMAVTDLNDFMGNMDDSVFTDVLGDLGKLEWNDEQAGDLLMKATNALGGVETWTGDTLKNAAGLMSKMEKTDLAKMPPARFKEAAAELGGLNDWDMDRAMEMGKLAMGGDAFGSPDTWDVDTGGKLGGIIVVSLPRILASAPQRTCIATSSSTRMLMSHTH